MSLPPSTHAAPFKDAVDPPGQDRPTDGDSADADLAVSVRGLVKSYKDVRAVVGIDLAIRRGETFALLGPNGAGKSTTIEILEGYRSRDGGQVTVLGVDPARGGPAWKARLGIVAQTTPDAVPATVREEIAHVASFYPAPRDVDQVIAAVGLADKATTRIAALSGGQRRRLDVALGIVGDPELLFLDEPTTGFDPQARHDFWTLIDSFKRGGTTILLTTHYLDEAAHLADRAAVIDRGQIIAVGPVDTLGGSAARTPVVRWRTGDGTPRQVRTDTPGAVVAALVADGGEPAELAVVRPSLEDVYLALLDHGDGADDVAAAEVAAAEVAAADTVITGGDLAPADRVAPADGIAPAGFLTPPDAPIRQEDRP